MGLGLEVGHGGGDRGAQRHGLDEAVLNLGTCCDLAHALSRNHIRVELSRSIDEAVSFHERALRLVTCDWVFCIHHNAAAHRASGVEVYVLPSARLEEKLVARRIIDAMPGELRSGTSRIIEADPHEAAWLQNPHNVLRQHKGRKILIEVGYLSSLSDVEIIRSPWGRAAIVAALSAGAAYALRFTARDF